MGATVITNLASAVPIYGTDIVVWFWGAFSVDVPTLNRFFALHYLFPFVLSGLIALHLFFLHEAKSGEPLGLSSIKLDGIPFGFYYIIKDLYGFIFYFMAMCVLVFYMPNLLGHSDYYILRSIADKLQGVVVMMISIFILILVPLVLNNLRQTHFIPLSGLFRPFYEKMVQIFFGSAVILGWIGGNPAVDPYITIAH